ncbi:sucrose-specific PTS transporter subunit IIBC [Enterococcus faecium]|uniref:sucrose-specific PTS transporter subunit IIBC n=1 Tax=Enterococcus faecium TaxID=1352 RepID=UPI001930EB87|nr:sucrose-specific PTS transporter subunit IIBC [Enterococcus faecium]HJG22193.1 sucrose-specific PTS transporter subunit IIBC [Enterococcus durans]MDG4641143.1 sucrose-specific PTS transporter subunit IIBC [Enterococcus faecium]MDK4439681.1 sucrose-specific PTS transporter subunit IIBC [Enterococcus faecium]MDK4461690.1 sucrose-specific PTS transporter subunit IIBC [Enterococcus faecium]MDT2326443.1 sucrose-specific PTS transporter subunit IIBC [Enterococcus faecium]
MARDVIDAVGGQDNISSMAHCATRLRLVVKDRDKIQDEKVENIDKAKGFFFTSGQYQIIFGTGIVNRVYEAMEEVGVSATTKEGLKEQAAEKEGSSLKRLIRVFGDVFVPIIPALVTTGLFMGLRGLLTQPQILGLFGMTPDSISSNVIMVTQILTDTAFAFLPVLVCWSAFRVFGGSPLLGILLGLMLVSPSLPTSWDVAQGTGDPLLFFGFIKVAGYQGSVLPAFIMGFLGANIEKKVRKVVPPALDLILTPFISLLAMLLLALFLVGPVFHEAEMLLLHAVEWILNLPFGLGGLIYGGLNQIIVVTGLHHALNLIEIQLLAETGWNPVNMISTASIVAQAGAAFAVGLKSKKTKVKAVAFPSTFSALLGITEPAMFGVNLRYGKPFIMGLIGGAVGGFLASIFNMQATGMSITAIPGLLLYLNNQFFMYILISVISFFVAFGLTWMFGYNDDMLEK